MNEETRKEKPDGLAQDGPPSSTVLPEPPEATATPRYKLGVAYILGILWGFWGAHHFYLGRRRWGLLYVFTCGLAGMGYIVDLFRMPCLVRRMNKLVGEPEYKKTQMTIGEGYMMWFPFGFFGAHHFRMGSWIWGIVYIFTGGLAGTGWLFDGISMRWLVKRYNDRLEQEYIRQVSQQPQDEEESKEEKDFFTAYRLAVFPLTGLFGVHHYYLGRKAFGIFCTLTLSGGSIIYWADMIRLSRIIRDIKKRTREGKSLEVRRLDDCYLMAIPFGMFGSHHFYLRRPGWGCLYLFTCGLFGIGWIIDLFRMPKLVRGFKVDLESKKTAVGGLSTVGFGGHDNPTAVTKEEAKKQEEMEGQKTGLPPQFTTTLPPGVYHFNPGTQLPGVDAPEPPPEYSPPGYQTLAVAAGGNVLQPPSYDESLNEKKPLPK